MNLLKFLNQPNLSQEEINKLPTRISSRAIITNEQNEVALLYSHKFDYYEIPGGSVDKKETIEQGIIRECLEETGCTIKIIKELGLIKGLKLNNNKYQLNESYGFLAKKQETHKCRILMLMK